MKAIILAAGQGTRMCSATPKVLHPIMGKPFLQYVPEACIKAGISDITIVVGNDGDAIKSVLGESVKYAIQAEPLGTGHAVLSAAENVQPNDDILILAGDMPLITADFINNLIAYYTQKDRATIVAAVHKQNTGDFGRVYANEDSHFESIIEARDLGSDSPPSNWVNTSIYLFKGEALLYGLSHMENNNSQKEYYLTDVPKILKNAGSPVYVYPSTEDEAIFTGINTQAQLAEATQHMRNRINLQHMENGVRMFDPATTYIDAAVQIEPNVVIYPGCILEGCCVIEADAIIGPYTHMQNTTIGKHTAVRQSVLTDAKVGSNTTVGPFAYLRPGAVIGNKCRVGNFVEIKNATLADGAKAAHLAYIGDADIGRNVNYSCGVITANYDGKNKHRTTIKDGAFIGSSSNLVAPVEIGEGAFIAAGSTITNDVPDYSMGIARERQVTKNDWVKNKR